MPETTFHTTFSSNHFLLSRAKNGSESGLRSAVSYRFGFNGKENDNEVKGTGNQQDYGMRIYDPRLGRFLSADPLIVQGQKYAWYSPYQFAGNKPILCIDLDGLEDIAYIYKMEGDEKVLIQTIDYTQTSEGTGPLGHGVYRATINSTGDKFTEVFVSYDNSIPSFSESNIELKNWTNVESRLNARLIEKTVELALVKMGYNPSEVEKDVQVLDSNNPDFQSKFATFKEGTAEKYTSSWEKRPVSPAHASNNAKGSGDIGNTTLELKYYDGAASSSDKIPNQVGFTQNSSGLGEFVLDYMIIQMIYIIQCRQCIILKKI
jgi:RHS repeat-associated protein